MSDLGKILVVLGVLFIIAGLVLWIGGRIPFSGRLPGDILVRRENFTFYFPIATSLILSLLLTLLIFLFRR